MFDDFDESGDGSVNIMEFTRRMDQFSAALSESAGTICAKMMNFALKTSKFALKTSKFALKTWNRVSKARNLGLKMMTFAVLHLCQHLDREKISLADVFKGVDVDGSGDLTLAEFHAALLRLNIPHAVRTCIAD